MYARIPYDRDISPERAQIVKVKVIRDEECDLVLVEFSTGSLASIGVAYHEGQYACDIVPMDINPFHIDDAKPKIFPSNGGEKITLFTLYKQLTKIQHTMATKEELNSAVQAVADGLAKLGSDLDTLQKTKKESGAAIVPSELDAPIAKLKAIAEVLTSLDAEVVAETGTPEEPAQ